MSWLRVEISGILLTVDLRVMDMSEFDVILGMDWLTTYRVVIEPPTRRTVLLLYFRGISKIFCPKQCTSPSVMDSSRVG